MMIPSTKLRNNTMTTCSGIASSTETHKRLGDYDEEGEVKQRARQATTNAPVRTGTRMVQLKHEEVAQATVGEEP